MERGRSGKRFRHALSSSGAARALPAVITGLPGTAGQPVPGARPRMRNT